jgi:4-hydroxybenzoate polyprenyltransferase
MLREYLKLSRSFNAALTGAAPALGGIANGGYEIWHLFILFLIGFLGHSYGFALNDILDLKIDQISKELYDRPLVSKNISLTKAWVFTFANLFGAIVLAIALAVYTTSYFPLVFLFISAGLITLYDIVSKKYPGMDIFVASGVFALILYGVLTISRDITLLAWIVCFLGSIQVLFMQFIAGGLKDIDHDSTAGANTLAIKLGVRENNKKLTIPPGFRTLAYGIQGIDICILFLPFILVFSPLSFFHYIQILFLFLLCLFMLWISKRLVNLKQFDRDTLRKYIGSHYLINYSLVPLMLMALTPWVGLLIFLFPAGFLVSNLALHGTLLHPKTM